MGEITLRKALDDYKTIYMAYRNFAERTREEYHNDLEDLVGFLEEAGINHVKEIGLPNIERYIARLEEKGFTSLTRKRKVVAIRSFLFFLYQDSYIDSDIAKKIVLPFAENTTPHVLTQLECDRLRIASFSNPRDRAIIELLLQTGIKLSELTRLTLNDIDLDNSEGASERQPGSIRVLGSRGKKERMIPLKNKASDAIKSYLAVREAAENNILFLNRFGDPVSDRGVQKMVRRYLKKAGIERASVHTLRHTFGAQHIAEGTNLKAIQKIMGLKDSRSTSIYTSLAKGLLKNELRDHII